MAKKEKRERENGRMQGVSWLVFLEISSLLQEGFLSSCFSCLHSVTSLHISIFLCIFIQSFSLFYFLAYLCPYLECVIPDEEQRSGV